MVDYTKPEMSYVGSLAEGVYADSGKPEKNDWRVITEYRGHNSGSHSELWINAHNNGKKSGTTVKMHFHTDAFKFLSVGPTGDNKITISNITENSFDITWIDAFNPNQDIAFIVQFVIQNSPYGGAACPSGDTTTPSAVFCTDVQAF